MALGALVITSACLLLDHGAKAQESPCWPSGEAKEKPEGASSQ
jgi:hypothetical protein